MLFSTSALTKILTSFALLLPSIYYFVKRYWLTEIVEEEEDAQFTEGVTNPPLLKKYVTIKSYHVPKTGFTYPSIRTFFRQHPQIDRLPTEPTPLPLLVAVHGLGGSIAQFDQILPSLINVAPTLAIDLPGCGSSSFQPEEKKAYTAHALVHLLAVVIEKHRNMEANQGVILFCHSMGCSLGCLLASTTSPYKDLISRYVCAVVAICPAVPLSLKQRVALRMALLIPESVFEYQRKRDRCGGTGSPSVARFVGPKADKRTKKLQLIFNKQSRTAVWRRMASGGLLPNSSSDPPFDGIPGQKIWQGMKMPIFLVAGKDDHITPADNICAIASWLGHRDAVKECNLSKADKGKAGEHGQPRETIEQGLKARAGNIVRDSTSAQDREAASTKPTIPEQDSSTSTTSVFQATILPSPAAHALLYTKDTARILSAHMRKFLSNVDERLDPGWQLHYLNQGGKWDVKNLGKWREVIPVSKPIAGFFRALKTLRDVDERHTPKVFVEEWSPRHGNGKDGLGSIAAIIDITHDAPVYDPDVLLSGGISYTKWPTVSKFPPTADRVKAFIELVDSIHADMVSGSHDFEPGVHRLIAVHCHYGFNRTGFFIVAYMVEKLGWTLKNAIAEFAEAKGPGIRHAHFIDELYAQYPNESGEDG
ncbi:Alpha/beta hydrolase fold-1 [Venturia nashicola]|uniref:Alpha/beta hydrolase fold-1 n=1 Tax=Venturia nashicola TaxID=86259 RepID=A0A4Z1NJT0_9PEZI|nr:Alpha/beta hydrolase fold-1 [Venturia nashicola]